MSDRPDVVPAGRDLCALFPTSRSLDDLDEPFRLGVIAFLAEVRAAGATVKVAATRRPYARAWLMRAAWDVASGAAPVSPWAYPDPPAGVPEIEWTVEGARAMLVAYGAVHRPSLTSRHIDGRAIDMSIRGWPGTTEELIELGASHGVYKLRSDPPHWSDDGR